VHCACHAEVLATPVVQALRQLTNLLVPASLPASQRASWPCTCSHWPTCLHAAPACAPAPPCLQVAGFENSNWPVVVLWAGAVHGQRAVTVRYDEVGCVLGMLHPAMLCMLCWACCVSAMLGIVGLPPGTACRQWQPPAYWHAVPGMLWVCLPTGEGQAATAERRAAPEPLQSRAGTAPKPADTCCAGWPMPVHAVRHHQPWRLQRGCMDTAPRHWPGVVVCAMLQAYADQHAAQLGA